jgi:hypothetical protein
MDCLVKPGPLWDDLDQLNDELDDYADLQTVVVGTAVTTTTGLTVGYVLWTIRGGLLASSLLAQMPAWRLVDPLVVLSYGDQSDPAKNEEEDESLESIIEGTRQSS